MEPDQHKANMKASKTQERRIARKIGGRVNPASGATPWTKHDVSSTTHTVEAKTTTHQSFSIKKLYWQQFARSVRATGRVPVMCIDIDGVRLVVMEERDVGWD